jgi:hypothetical protein
MSDIGQQDTRARDALERHAATVEDLGTYDTVDVIYDEHLNPDA